MDASADIARARAEGFDEGERTGTASVAARVAAARNEGVSAERARIAALTTPALATLHRRFGLDGAVDIVVAVEKLKEAAKS